MENVAGNTDVYFTLLVERKGWAFLFCTFVALLTQFMTIYSYTGKLKSSRGLKWRACDDDGQAVAISELCTVYVSVCRGI